MDARAARRRSPDLDHPAPGGQGARRCPDHRLLGSGHDRQDMRRTDSAEDLRKQPTDHRRRKSETFVARGRTSTSADTRVPHAARVTLTFKTDPAGRRSREDKAAPPRDQQNGRHADRGAAHALDERRQAATSCAITGACRSAKAANCPINGEQMEQNNRDHVLPFWPPTMAREERIAGADSAPATAPPRNPAKLRAPTEQKPCR